MIQCLLFKWKSNISSPASHTRYPLFSPAITHSAHTNTLLNRTDRASSHHFPTLQQAQSFSPACAYRGTRRERVVSGNLDTAWPKIKPEPVSANWKTSHSLGYSKCHSFILLTSLVLLILIHTHICTNRLNVLKQTRTRLKLQLLKRPEH